MAKYVSTGKINFPKTILGLLFGIGMGILLGLTYGWAMDVIPFIIVDLFVFAIVIALVMVTGLGVVHIGVIRNSFVKAFAALTVCLVAWYAQWVYTVRSNFWSSLLKFDRVFDEVLHFGDTHELTFGRMLSSSDGSGISGTALMVLYAFELLIFLLPVIFLFKFEKGYFCESCGKFNKQSDFYVSSLDENKLPGAEMSGDFRFISELSSYKKPPQVTGAAGHQAWKVEFSSCPQCEQNGVIDIERGKYKAEKTGKILFSHDKTIVNRTLVNNLSTTALLEKTHG